MQEKLTALLKEWNIPYYAWNLIVIGIAILAGLLIKLLLSLFIKGKARETGEFHLFYSILVYLGKPLNYFLPLFLLNILMPVMRLERPFTHAVPKTVEILLIVTFSWMLIQSIKVLQEFILHKYDYNKADNLRERKIRTQLVYVRQVITGLIILLTIAAILLTFDTMRKIGAGLLTGVGIGGIIIGFAAQRSLGNLLAGFQIAFTQPIRIEDVVVVENEFGTIEEITLTYVVVKIWDQRRLILPINYFIEKPFQNWTRTSSDILGTVFFYADYTLPIDPVRQELTRLLNSTTLWDGKVGGIAVTNAQERTIEVRVTVSATSSGTAWDLRCYLRENLLKFINENYPQCLPRIRTDIEHMPINNSGNNTVSK